MLKASGNAPRRLTLPYVGFNPAMPQKAAGLRIEPLVSLPRPPSTMPAATAAAVPLEEPPVKCPGFHGLRAGGHGRSNDGPPKANSCVASFPISTAPDAARRAVTAASSAGT